MAIDYQPLLDIMGKKKISWYRLEKLGIDNRTVHQLRHNLNITTGTLASYVRFWSANQVTSCGIVQTTSHNNVKLLIHCIKI